MIVRKKQKVHRSLWAMALAICTAVALSISPASAQVRGIDPDTAIDGDLMGGELPPAQPAPVMTPEPPIDPGVQQSAGNGTPLETWEPSTVQQSPVAAPIEETTYRKDDLIGAAEGVFGQGAEGLASMIESLLNEQGEPNGYIVGREGSGAFAFGLRYGSGTLFHKVEGNRSVYWTGPSVGFDVGLNAGKAFVLVYNLYDSEDLFRRYGAGEGQAYLVGGFHVSYLRRGDVVLIPVRMGAGMRLGANIGYMKFSEKQRWLPF